jgi:hypothetical protein
MWRYFLTAYLAHDMILLWQNQDSLKDEWEWFTRTTWNLALAADKVNLVRISTALHEITADFITTATLESFESVLKMT